MADHYQPRSKGTWGREDAKSSEELNRLCNEFFDSLKVPSEWKDMGWTNAVDPQLGLISVGKAFRDTRTSGIDLMHYRIYFSTFSQRGGLVEISMIDFGKYAYRTIGHGIFKVDDLNEFIASRYKENPSALLVPLKGDIKEKENDNADGLQHFRDRFNNTEVDNIREPLYG
jgi:hypothetical protein